MWPERVCAAAFSSFIGAVGRSLTCSFCLCMGIRIVPCWCSCYPQKKSVCISETIKWIRACRAVVLLMVSCGRKLLEPSSLICLFPILSPSPSSPTSFLFWSVRLWTQKKKKKEEILRWKTTEDHCSSILVWEHVAVLDRVHSFSCTCFSSSTRPYWSKIE